MSIHVFRARTMSKCNFNPIYDPETISYPDRITERPQQRWDAHIRRFYYKIWQQYHCHHWFDMLSCIRIENDESEYMLHLRNKRLH